MRSLFSTAEQRTFVLEKYNAIQGAHETLDRLEVALAEMKDRT